MQILVHFKKMNDKDEIIAKLKEENEYLKSLLRVHNISFEKPKEKKYVVQLTMKNTLLLNYLKIYI